MGVAIDALTPAEIAVSIVAELIATRRKDVGAQPPASAPSTSGTSRTG